MQNEKVKSELRSAFFLFPFAFCIPDAPNP
jgi:hypothetical protein